MMGETFLSSIGWLGLANAAVSALLVGLALVCTRWSRSTTLVSVLWTLAILKLISPAFATIPVPLPAISWAAIDTPRTESSNSNHRDSVASKTKTKPSAATPHLDRPSNTAATAPLQTRVIHWSALLTAFFAVWLLGSVALATLALTRIVSLQRLIRRAEPRGWLHH